MPPADALTVHIIDDDDGVREGLSLLLSEGGLPVKSYRSAVEFLSVLENAAPGCIVSDIRMPGMDGLELQQKLKSAGNTMPIMFITGHGDIPMAVQALRQGAVDFIEKPFDENVLLESIQLALKSAQSMLSDSSTTEVKQRLASLTPREREVLECLVMGKLNKITAFELGMSIRTVEVHRAHVMQKMRARSLSELIRLVIGIKFPVAPASEETPS